MSDNKSLSWQEQLAALASGLPQGEETEVVPAEEQPSRKYCGKLVVTFEKKGRGGKQATIISGFKDISDSEIADLASEMKKKLGAGGSSRGGEILIQGDRRNDVTVFLRGKGFKI